MNANLLNSGQPFGSDECSFNFQWMDNFQQKNSGYWINFCAISHFIFTLIGWLSVQLCRGYRFNIVASGRISIQPSLLIFIRIAGQPTQMWVNWESAICENLWMRFEYLLQPSPHSTHFFHSLWQPLSLCLSFSCEQHGLWILDGLLQ